MQFKSLPADLQTWLRDSVLRGSTPQSLEQAMLTAGYQRKLATQAIALAFKELKSPPAAPASSGALPVVTLASAESNAVQIADQRVDILFSLDDPEVKLFGGLLSELECDQLVEFSRPKLERSNVVNTESGAFDVHPHRTSSGTHFRRGENQLVSRIEQRIAALLSYPVERGEPLQILHYEPGAEYRPHFDYFDPAQAGNDAVLKVGGQRVATLIIYLNDVEAGGATIFPELDLSVLPRKGNAVYFTYTSLSGTVDARSLHGGNPVLAGEKWIATKWLRQRNYGA